MGGTKAKRTFNGFGLDGDLLLPFLAQYILCDATRRQVGGCFPEFPLTVNCAADEPSS